MASTETVPSDHSAPSEREVQSEVKKIEAEDASPPSTVCVEKTQVEESTKIEEKQQIEDAKDGGDDEKPKAVSAEPIEEKIEDKQQIETPSIEDTKDVGDDEKTEGVSAEPREEEIDNKPVEAPPPADGHHKTDKEKVVDVSIVNGSDKVEEKSEEPEADEKPGEETIVATTEDKTEEVEKVVDVSESLLTEENKESEQESPAKVVEPIEANEATVPQISEPDPVVEQKLTEQIEIENPIEGTKLQEQDEMCPIEGLDQVKAEDLIAQAEEKHVESYRTGEVKEPEEETTEVKGPLEKKSVELGKDEVEIRAPEEKSVVAEELVQCEEKPTDIAKSSSTEKVTRELEAEEKIEQNVQATEAKLEEVKQVDEKIDDNVEATKAKEEEKQVCEPAKIEFQNPAGPKDSVETKTSQDVLKEGVPAKTQKPSFVKIVKQSLVKAKKAIIWKSQNAKTPASEPKDDGNN